MEQIKLNHWYIHKNNLSISLMRFHVFIQILCMEENIHYLLQINDGQGEKIVLSFPTLEEAISFTENEIVLAPSLVEIKKIYEETFQEKQKIKNK